METVQGTWIALDKWADLSQIKTSGPLLYAKSQADAEKVYKSLLGASGAFKVYRRAKVPAHLHYNSNPREGDPVVVPTGPYAIVAPFENVNVYPLVANILGLRIGAIDGNLRVLQGILKKNSQN